MNAKDHSQGTKYTTSETYWEQRGGKIMDEFQWTADHTTTVGFDIVRLYDGDRADVSERVNKEGTFIQHQWGILPSLDLKAGARYEDLKIRVSNNPTTQITTQGNWIIRKWDEVIPKSFLTWKMDSLSDGLRDTSLSAGISKIWHAPDNHGTYNPQGRTARPCISPGKNGGIVQSGYYVSCLQARYQYMLIMVFLQKEALPATIADLPYFSKAHAPCRLVGRQWREGEYALPRYWPKR